MDNSIPLLYKEKSECSACGACVNICKLNAISMQEDMYGFLYPVIDEKKCIGCGRCKKVCALSKEKIKNVPLMTYAAVTKNEILLKESASGGAFATLANEIVKEGGAAFGAAFSEDWSVHHIEIKKCSDLIKLQGSKYTQSSIDNTFIKVETYLKSGIKVIFSGTPCQIMGLKAYLGVDYENLLTIDIICHGVPNNKMFKEYLSHEANGNVINDFSFRDKDIGWGINGYIKIDGRKKVLWQSASSYLYYFTRGWIYRDSCYKCKYACEHRPADITIGDFWGIEKQHPELLGPKGWDETKGISVMIINTLKGKHYIEKYSGEMEIKQSTFLKAAKGNKQLRQPNDQGKRTEILSVYLKKGWTGVQNEFEKNIGIRKYSSKLKNMLPPKIKKYIKKLK